MVLHAFRRQHEMLLVKWSGYPSRSTPFLAEAATLPVALLEATLRVKGTLKVLPNARRW